MIPPGRAREADERARDPPTVLFNSFEYIAFLLLVFALYWACVRYVRVALGVLLAASLPGFAFVPSDSVVALTLTDTGRTILLRPGRWQGVGQSGNSYDEPGVLRVTDLAPDAGFAGTAEHVDRWLWGRGDEPEADGDETALTAVRDLVAQGIQ